MIAMALACRPALLIADEPTTALDVTVQAQILALLERLRRELNMAMILITHDLGVVAEACDDVAVMYGGRIVERAPVGELLRHPRHPYTRGLLRAMPKAESTNPHHVPAEGGPRLRLQEIPGLVPGLGKLPAGCGFAPRCPNAADDCRGGTPPLVAVSSRTPPAGGAPARGDHESAPAHDVSCLHPDDGEPERRS
jgi:oligopeptide/dipeptide ABC transporter ATP-binding protein